MEDRIKLGKVRRLQQCATPNGALAILAVDHRNSLRRALNPKEPEAVPGEDLATFKQKVVSALGPSASAVLMDPEYGAPRVIETGALPGATGLVVSLEESGYEGDQTARESRLLPGWSVTQASRLGANAVKLLVYYHPEAPTARKIEALVERVAGACLEGEIPFFLEPLSYSLDRNKTKLSAEERRRVVIETARRLTAIQGVDVLKAEFPVDVKSSKYEVTWMDACQELTMASRVPWVLLSAGVDFETYLSQVSVATRAGASGVAVGRAVWKEVLEIPVEERVAFLDSVARERMERLGALCRALASPWTDSVRE